MLNPDPIQYRNVKIPMSDNRYRKKAIEIEAIQWDGKNTAEVCIFGYPSVVGGSENRLMIHTVSGPVWAGVGDFIIKNKGECYPCNALMFYENYEKIHDRMDYVDRISDRIVH